LDKWDVENQDLVGKANRYNYADFTAYDILNDREQRFSVATDALQKDRKEFLTKEDIDTVQLEYNKFNDHHKGLEQFREVEEIEPERYEEGKQVYENMKESYIQIGHESFLDALLAEKSYDEDSLGNLKNMENVKNDNIRDYDDINVAEVLEELKQLKSELVKKTDNLDAFADNKVETEIFKKLGL